MYKVSKKTNTSIYMVKKILEQNNISVRNTAQQLFLNHTAWIKENKTKNEEIIKLYQTGYSCNKIANLYGCSGNTILNILSRNNVPRRSPRESKILLYRKTVGLRPQLLECIEGEMLGDGHIMKGRAQSAIRIKNTCKEYRDLWVDNFDNYSIPISPKGIYKEILNEGRTTAYVVRTSSTVEFHSLRQKWYPRGIKIIPKSLKITPNLLLYWWIGDGSLRGNGVSGIFCSECFIKIEQEELLHKINIALDWRLRLQKNNSGYRIFIPCQYMRDFLDYIGPPPVNSMAYKWNIKNYVKTNKLNINKDDFYDLYITQNKTAIEMSKIYRCARGTIYQIAKEYNIKKDPNKRPKCFGVKI